MATELAAAYVTIIPSLTGAGKTIEKALGGVNVSAVGSRIGSGLGSKIASGIGGALSLAGKTVIGAAAAVGAAAVGTAISGGISRAMKLDNAQMKFEALGMDVESAMASCNEAVTGTAYGLDAAATVAASLAASGVAAGDDMTNALKGVAGMAAMSGTSMEHVGIIWGKVAAQGKLQGDELTQFAENGVAALPALAKYLNLTNAETQKLVSAGEISFETFAAAMYASFGEAAQGANETFSGAMSNVNAALSRIGAKFATPGLESLRKVFVALIPAINAVSKLFDPLVEKFTKFTTAVSDRTVAGIEKFTEVLNNGGSFLQAFAAGVRTALDGTAVGNFISFVTGLVKLFTMAETPMQGFKLVLDAIKLKLDSFGQSSGFTSLMDRVREKIATLPEPVQNVIAKIQEFFSSINLGGAAALGGFALILSRFGAPLTTLVTNIGKFGGVIAGFFGSFSKFGGIFAFIAMKFRTFMSAITLCGGGVKGLAVVLGSGLKTALAGLFSPVSLIVGGIAALAAAFVYLMTTNEGFRSTIMGLVSSIGQSLAPVITTIVGTVTELAASLVPLITNLVAQLVPVLGQIIVVIFQVIDALAPVIATIVGVVVPIVTDIVALVVQVAAQVISAVLPVISAILGAIQTAMPIIKTIITAVMAVIQTTIQIVWPIVQKVITTVVNTVMNVIQTVMPLIQSIITRAMGFIQSIIETVWPIIQTIISTVATVVLGVISTVWPIIQGIISAVSYAIEGVIGFVWPIISGIIEGTMSFIQGIIDTVMSLIQGDWEGAWENIKGALSSAWDSISSGVQAGIDNLMEWVGSIPEKIKGFFSDAGSWLLDAGRNILTGLWEGIKGGFGWLGEKLGSVGSFIIEHKGPKAYDLKMLVPNGQWIMSSLCAGIESGMPKLQGTLSGVTAQVKDWSAEMQPYQSVDATMRTWSNAHIITSDERDAERADRYEQALKHLGDRIEGMRVVMDSGELVGATAGKYDRALSRRQLIAERGF